MKYIRTINGKVFALDLENEEHNEFYHHYKDNPFLEPFEEVLVIIKQADTIEELCDEFVRVSKSIHDFLVSEDIPTKKFVDTEIYGAIWTEWGLKYVAKMNDKGELELL